jgi:cold shock CspA family protein
MISSAKAKGFIRVNENRMNVFVEPEKVIDGFEELLKKTIEGNLKWLNTI